METFFKLFPEASTILRNLLSSAGLLNFGISIDCLRDKYCPVRLFLFFLTSSGVPVATILPPSNPAAGPRSMR